MPVSSLAILSCGDGVPFGARLFPRRFSGSMVTRVIVIAGLPPTDDQPAPLLLLDSGLSTSELTDPRRLGMFARTLGLLPGPERSALSQLRSREIDPGRVTDIALTHLDLDHAGGLADFPEARVHVLREERDAAESPRSWGERLRYRPAQWRDAKFAGEGSGPAATPQPVEITAGITGIPIPGWEDSGVLRVALPGHTRGHCGFWIPRAEDSPIFFVGDAYYDHSERSRRASIFFRCFLGSVQVKPAEARASLETIQTLCERFPNLEVLSSHDPTEGRTLPSLADLPNSSIRGRDSES